MWKKYNNKYWNDEVSFGENLQEHKKCTVNQLFPFTVSLQLQLKYIVACKEANQNWAPTERNIRSSSTFPMIFLTIALKSLAGIKFWTA